MNDDGSSLRCSHNRRHPTCNREDEDVSPQAVDQRLASLVKASARRIVPPAELQGHFDGTSCSKTPRQTGTQAGETTTFHVFCQL